ncbi:MAG TPA: GlsB/YeaQ/YmgE family stress response membrane protein [Kofleriaceae bacterium]|jgi:uncharacterized membrane protein YeaQ/YmgE (transglycosylase-associated protein family)
MQLITWLVVGLIAGFLASAIMRSRFGLLGDIVLGIGGAFVGGWIFREAGWHAPFQGLAGVIAVAFVGAVVVLAVFRLVANATGRR